MHSSDGSPGNIFTEALRGITSLGGAERCMLSGLKREGTAYILSRAFVSVPRPMLALTASADEAEGLASDLKFFLGSGPGSGPVRLLPSSERLPFDNQPPHTDITARRLALLSELTLTETPLVIVASVGALFERTIPPAQLLKTAFELSVGREYQREELIERLLDGGYSRLEMVEERGEMSARGAILDIFPSSLDHPVRLEFFGDELESIRGFDPASQRSLNEIDTVKILPALEAVLPASRRRSLREKIHDRADELGAIRESFEPLDAALREGRDIPLTPLLPLIYDPPASIFEYLKLDTIVALIDPVGIDEEVEGFSRDLAEVVEGLKEAKTFFSPAEGLYLDGKALNETIKGFCRVEFHGRGSGAEAGAMEIECGSNADIREDIKLKKDGEYLKPLAVRICGWLDHGFFVYLTAHNRGQAERTIELLEGYGLNPPIVDSFRIVKGAVVGEGGGGSRFFVSIGTLSRGLRVPEAGLVVISEEEVFGRRQKRRPPAKQSPRDFLKELRDLKPGDAIVHAKHGIGFYRGLKRISVEGMESDFLSLEYRDDATLYLPVEGMEAVTKYHGVEGRAFTLDRLGGTGWAKRAGRAKRSVEKLAAELLKLYTERKLVEGFSFSEPGHDFKEFEAAFEFEETPDQARAIEETLAEMEAPVPMDRLVCGDVGYGKTEVAMRAAFKAVFDSKQVAVLVPTTVLAEQHFQTFSERFAPWPVTVEVISRFKGRKGQKETVERVARGEVDILIGTHRLLGSDVAFKNLGLVVIDEEHRFGVKNKERLRGITGGVDVLTLTATPIPRTLQMSLGGVRGLSIISTPPEDRQQTRTVIARFDERIIKEAIERELKRGGQVFFVHNRVGSIGGMGERIKRLVPEARIAVAHGQMKEAELEERMMGFVRSESDILLSTSIIESGLDIPTANTIIINRADTFGLAELYQLRGRVGRSSHRAYAYFLCPEGQLTAEAEKRLDAVAEMAGEGGGFRLASLDLEIRGAGELLGESQSGRIADVGFDMYMRLLEETVGEMTGTPVTIEPSPEVNLKVSRYIPDDYVPDPRQKLALYKRLSDARSESELDEVRAECEDRYGPVPELVMNLLRCVELKLMLKRIGATEISERSGRLYIAFPHGGGDGGGASTAVVERALALRAREPARVRLTPEGKLVYSLAGSKESGEPAKTDAIGGGRYILKALGG